MIKTAVTKAFTENATEIARLQRVPWKKKVAQKMRNVLSEKVSWANYLLRMPGTLGDYFPQ